MPKSDNISFVTHLLLSELKVKVNKSTLSKCIKTHSDYPSLLTICDCLTTFNVSYQVYQIDKDDYKDRDISYPFITHFSKKGGSFILVHGITDGQVRFSDESNNNNILSVTEFLRNWDGIMLNAVANVSSGEQDFYQNRLQYVARPIAVLFLIITGVLVPLLYFLHSSNWLIFSLHIINYLGLITCIFLLRHTINANDPIFKQLCGRGKTNPCNLILNSPAAKITSWLSWSEVGFFYFSGCYLLLLVNPQVLSLLFWINLSSIPFVFYSLIYQYIKKTVCFLCSMVQVLLIAEFVILNFSLSNRFGSFNIYGSPDITQLFKPIEISDISSNAQLVKLLLCFMIPILVWVVLKPILLKASSAALLSINLDKFRHNSELFASVLKSQIQQVAGAELDPIIIGNAESDNIITIVSNPLCEPCGRAHRMLDEWSAWNPDLQIQILLIGYNDHQEKIVRHFIALNLEDNQPTIRKSLADWYNQIDQGYDNWVAKYPVLFDHRVADIYAHQKEWTEQVNIIYTPTIFVNGYLLPEPYQLEDLKFLINYTRN